MQLKSLCLIIYTSFTMTTLFNVVVDVLYFIQIKQNLIEAEPM